MKHWYLTLVACLLALASQAQVAPFGLTVISQETPVANGTLSFRLLAVAQAAGQANYTMQVESPTFSLSGSTKSAGGGAALVPLVQAGDTLRETITLEPVMYL